jgi:hypothetical protein
VIFGAGRGKGPGWGDHPDGEVVVRDAQFHGPAEECCDARLELPAGKELKARAVGPVVDKDADELLGLHGWPVLVADAFQQPLGRERVPAEGEGPQG